MKKLFVFIAAAVVLTSCQWIAETFYSPADCIEWYCDALYDAANEGDVEKFKELTDDMEDYWDDIELRDLVDATQALQDWQSENIDKLEKIASFAEANDVTMELEID